MAKQPSLLSEVEFGSFLIYSPRGKSEVSQTSREIRDAIKQDWPGKIAFIAERLKLRLPGTGLDRFLSSDMTLVPMPGHAPLVSRDALWVPRRICEELLKQGLGKEILPCLRRDTPVAKAAFSGPGMRPKAKDHLESMSVERVLIVPETITLVDDIVTKGSSILAGASLLKEAFPTAEVKAFAVIRTMGRVAEIERLREPCVGKISLRFGEGQREP